MPPSKPFIVEAETTVIGVVAFNGWDAAMAIAFGIFRPNDAYVQNEHATVMDGRELPNWGKLRLFWSDGRPLACDAVGLLDYAASAGIDGREITAFGVRDNAFFDDG